MPVASAHRVENFQKNPQNGIGYYAGGGLDQLVSTIAVFVED